MKRVCLGLLAVLLGFFGCRDRDADLPQASRDLDVPEARLTAASAREQGRRLFLAHCAICHGESADGHGIRREGIIPPPQDFTDPAWRRRNSPRRIFYAIREGMRGTGMPSWKSLDDAEIWDLVAYVQSVSEDTQ
jgi:mono/diheme cytochrome c family protein